MKRIQLLALGAILSLVGQAAYPYAIVHDKNSAIDRATIYVFKDRNKYFELLKLAGAPDSALNYADKIAGYAPKAGELLATKTGGTSQTVAEAVPVALDISKGIISAIKETGLMSEIFRKSKGVIAYHSDVVRGNQGRGAEWNWASIKDQYGLPRGSSLFIVITDKEYGEPLLTGTIPTDGLFGFTVTKDENGNLIGKESADAVSQYVPAR